MSSLWCRLVSARVLFFQVFSTAIEQKKISEGKHPSEMGLTSLFDSYGLWHLYICRSLFGHATFFVALLVFMKGTSCCVLNKEKFQIELSRKIVLWQIFIGHRSAWFPLLSACMSPRRVYRSLAKPLTCFVFLLYFLNFVFHFFVFTFSFCFSFTPFEFCFSLFRFCFHFSFLLYFF